MYCPFIYQFSLFFIALLFIFCFIINIIYRGKRKYAPLGETVMKTHKKLFSDIPFKFAFCVVSPKLQRIWSWNFGFTIRKTWAFIWHQKCITSGWALGDENVIGIYSLIIYLFIYLYNIITFFKLFDS